MSIRYADRGEVLETNYIGLAPGLVGIYEINFRMPAAVPPGEVSLLLTDIWNCAVITFDSRCGRGTRITTSEPVKLRVSR